MVTTYRENASKGSMTCKYLDAAAHHTLLMLANRLVDRFRELGYEDQDIKSIQQMSESQSDRVVTDRVWKNIRPALQTRIDTTMCVRLEREQAPIINSRKRLVKNAFDDYKRTLRPIEWIHLPPPGLIYAMPAFRSLIYKDLDVPLEQATCDEVARCLPEDIAAFNDKLKDRLLYSMAEDGAFGETARKAKRPPSGIDKEGCLALATSVFAYRTSGVNLALISYEDVAAHLAWTGTQPQSHGIDFYIQMADTQGKSRWVSTYYYLRSGPSTITSLIKALSLDPETTRPQDLDSLDRRFLCEGCNFLNLTYSWRTCISHHYSAHLWRAPDFTALNEKNSAILRQKEGTDPASDQEMWSCNHCTIHLNDLQTHAVVLKHVQETHAINDPEENVDLFHAYPTARLRPTPQQFLTADPLQQHLAADSA
ncbi:hypothetical protein EVJ58_g3180 [Rhodofomes roseus]|uniref:Uncharacterized protein n=1 Tax=Rhodofomes roseus TaxID=34475 RepID=A0A4Y9YM58_9APHY|nr:hypothetical protein EVJ58_g3180 [Rhodofomes roseus]